MGVRYGMIKNGLVLSVSINFQNLNKLYKVLTLFISLADISLVVFVLIFTVKIVLSVVTTKQFLQIVYP